jgi:hypothetical protein
MQTFRMQLTSDLAAAFFPQQSAGIIRVGTRGLSLLQKLQQQPKAVSFPRETRTKPDAFFSFQDLAERWRCSRGTVRNRLRASGATVLDFGGGRSKKTVAASVVYQIERKRTKRL